MQEELNRNEKAMLSAMGFCTPGKAEAVFNGGRLKVIKIRQHTFCLRVEGDLQKATYSLAEVLIAVGRAWK